MNQTLHGRKYQTGSHDAPIEWVSPAKLRHDLLAAVKEINVRPVHKSDRFDDIVQWVLRDLPTLAPEHPRTPEAVTMAMVWWKYRSPIT